MQTAAPERFSPRWTLQPTRHRVHVEAHTRTKTAVVAAPGLHSMDSSVVDTGGCTSRNRHCLLSSHLRDHGCGLGCSGIRLATGERTRRRCSIPPNGARDRPLGDMRGRKQRMHLHGLHRIRCKSDVVNTSHSKVGIGLGLCVLDACASRHRLCRQTQTNALGSLDGGREQTW